WWNAGVHTGSRPTSPPSQKNPPSRPGKKSSPTTDPHEGATMTNPFDDTQNTFLVLVNEEEQHSLCPELARIPDGWTPAHSPVPEDQAPISVTTPCTDLGPRSVRVARA